MPKLNLKLGILLLCLSAAWTVFAQTDYTIKTYNATATTASETTARTSRAPYEGQVGTTVTVKTFNSGTGTAASTSTSLSASEGIRQIAARIYETTISSGSMQTGVLYFAWNPANASIQYYYKDATGTCRIASFPTHWTVMP